MAESWEGDIDLHQGGRGTISFTLDVAAITGRIRVRRGESEEEHAIDGMWTGDHSSGVRDVTHFINGAAVRTCTTERCAHEAGPFPAGTITWGVRARSNNGGENRPDHRTIVIAPAQAAGRCRLRCRAVGPKAGSAAVFFVAVSRPGGSKAIATQPFSDAGVIEFENLPEGRLRLQVDTRADLLVRAQPVSQEVTCREDQQAEAVFTFS